MKERMPLNVFDFYSRCLLPLTPQPSVSRILELVTIGGETTDDFAKVVALDSEVQHWIRLTVSRLGFDRRISKIDQMITMLGQNRIRDLIIGRHIERTFISGDKTLLGEMKAKQDKEKETKKEPAKPKFSDAPPPTDGTEAAAPPEEEEPIPVLSDFKRYLEHAIRAEEVAIAIRNSYPGQAFAGGVIFDYLRYFLSTLDLSKLTDERLKGTDAFVDNIFVDGLRSGIAANEIMQKISIPHQKIVFMTAMLHNIGKGLLLAYDPVTFEKAFLMSTGAKDAKLRVDSTDAEESVFDFDHAHAGALFMGRIPFLREIERSIDYHHNPDILRFTNPGLYAMTCVMSVSGSLAKLYQRMRAKDANVDRLPDAKLMASREFQFLKLSPEDWKEIKSNYALKLMKVQL